LLQFVEESTKCMNPNIGCFPKRKNNLGEEEESGCHEKNYLKTWSHQFWHSYLQKCHSATQNYKMATMG